MNIEDAIKRYESWAEDDRIDLRIRKEHEQIAEWLKELKADRPQGEWLKFGLGRGTRILFCTNCERKIEVPLSQGDSNYDFCPNCGARMKGADDDQTHDN